MYMSGCTVGPPWLWPVACRWTPLASRASRVLLNCANAGKRQERLPLRRSSCSRSGVPCVPPTWTNDELGKRSSIDRFFGRVFLFFRLQRPAYSGWSTIVRQVALTYTASLVVGLAAWQAQRPDLIRSPKRVLAHLWEDSQL